LTTPAECGLGVAFSPSLFIIINLQAFLGGKAIIAYFCIFPFFINIRTTYFFTSAIKFNKVDINIYSTKKAYKKEGKSFNGVLKGLLLQFVPTLNSRLSQLAFAVD